MEYVAEEVEMSLASKLLAVLAAIRRDDVEQMRPFDRELLIDLCLHVATLASLPEKRAEIHKMNSGTVIDMRKYKREE